VNQGIFALIVASASSLFACGGASDMPTPTVAEASVPFDATADIAVDASPPARVVRTLKSVPLFGDTSPANLLIDPAFENGEFGVGRWNAGFGAAPGTFANAAMSDAPVGLAFPVGTLADTNPAGTNELSLTAEVTGGRGPFRAKVWISTQNAAASKDAPSLATISLVAAGNTTLDNSGLRTLGKSYDLKEDAAARLTLAGRTWHRMVAEIPDTIDAGAFFTLGFRPSKNTWLMQAPEFVPTELLKPVMARTLSLGPRTPGRSATAAELELVRRYRARPLISVPASALLRPRVATP
jgi:hypothetical protein